MIRDRNRKKFEFENEKERATGKGGRTRAEEREERRRENSSSDRTTTDEPRIDFIGDDSYERLACADNTARRSRERIPFSLFYRAVLVRQ